MSGSGARMFIPLTTTTAPTMAVPILVQAPAASDAAAPGIASPGYAGQPIATSKTPAAGTLLWAFVWPGQRVDFLSSHSFEHWFAG